MANYREPALESSTDGTGYHAHEDLPPSYESLFTGGNFLRHDGRLSVDLNSRLARTVSILLPSPKEEKQPTKKWFQERAEQRPWRTRLNVVIQVVGSRGDVQPFVALGQELKSHGHRVRLATHGVFEDFVRQAGIEFYSIGGDPSQLMSYMVKNPGLIPSLKTIRAGEISKKRKMINEMLKGCWASCIKPCPISEVPFVADAIIANPPSFAHIHCAQALGIPLQLMFTMPWTPTKEFPHPLAVIGDAKADVPTANRISYGIVEWMTWQGLGDIINRWRETLDLEPVPTSEAPFLAQTLKIPFTYCWSPALTPKPHDWPEYIDVCGFLFRDTPDFKPSIQLQDFLLSGPQPIYIGFGSIVVDDPEKLHALICDAVKASGTRAILARGWSQLGGRSLSGDIFYIDECPHEWLFQYIAAAVHHGGAGTTACSLRFGLPTAIIPFFGDQPFWGAMVAAAGAGPAPIPYKHLTASALTEAIRFCLHKETVQAARVLAKQVNAENGVGRALDSFHRNLSQDRLSCDVLPHHPAVWSYKKDGAELKISNLAAQILIENSRLDVKYLTAYMPKEVYIGNRRWDPITGMTSAAIGTLTRAGKSFGSVLSTPGSGASSDCAGVEGSSRTAGSVWKNIGKASGDVLKGGVIDLPYALAEGLHNAPKLYGDKVVRHEPITDWKSGAVAGGKNFALELFDGISGIVTKPIKGGKKDGAIGALKGVGKGLAGLYYKPLSATAGLFAYPAQGVYKSVYGMIHSKTRESIVKARHIEGRYILEKVKSEGTIDIESVLDRFEDICDGFPAERES